jgi:pentatricopeptide repeat protein
MSFASSVTPMREIQRAFTTTSSMFTLAVYVVGVVAVESAGSSSFTWFELLTKSSWAGGVPEEQDQALLWWEVMVVAIVFVLCLYMRPSRRVKSTNKVVKCAPKPEKITHAPECSPGNAPSAGVYIGGKGISTDSQVTLRLQGETRRDEGDVAVLKAYTKLMSSCARGGQWEQAVSLMREMSAKGVKPDVHCFSAAINACGKARKVKEALSLFHEMQTLGLRPDLVSYNALVGACSKCGFYKGAVAAIEEMRKEGVQPDNITYNAAISACANGGVADMALQFLEEMQSNGLEPDVITYSSVIDACAKSRMGERALKVLDDMKARGLTPNVITYNTAIGACSRARLPDRALELLREMVDSGLVPTHVSFSIAITCLAKCGRFTEAVELVRVMRIKNCNVHQLVKAYDNVIAICMELGNVDLALQLLRDLRKEGWIQDLGKYAPVLRAGARRGAIDDFDNVDQLLSERSAAGLTLQGLGPELPDGLKWRKEANR